jgi:hypothetical protein
MFSNRFVIPGIADAKHWQARHRMKWARHEAEPLKVGGQFSKQGRIQVGCRHCDAVHVEIEGIPYFDCHQIRNACIRYVLPRDCRPNRIKLDSDPTNTLLGSCDEDSAISATKVSNDVIAA